MIDVRVALQSTPVLRGFCAAETQQQEASRAFVQILGKLHFFQLLENLRRILRDYEPKRTGRTNAAFNAPC
jgi:hypothetical protein